MWFLFPWPTSSAFSGLHLSTIYIQVTVTVHSPSELIRFWNHTSILKMLKIVLIFLIHACSPYNFHVRWKFVRWQERSMNKHAGGWPSRCWRYIKDGSVKNNVEALPRQQPVHTLRLRTCSFSTIPPSKRLISLAPTMSPWRTRSSSSAAACTWETSLSTCFWAALNFLFNNSYGTY